MGLHPYCVVPAGAEPDGGVRGLEGAPVMTVAAGDLWVWASELEARPEAEVEALRIHDRVVRGAVAGDRVPLPVRFGAWFGSRGELAERIRDRADTYRDGLERVLGTREFAVRILENGPTDKEAEPPSPSGEEERPGTEYLEVVARRHAAHRRREERADRVLEALRQAVENVARDERVERSSSERGLLGVAHLVRTSDSDEYLGSVEDFRRAHRRLRVIATGPWVPYSFAP